MSSAIAASVTGRSMRAFKPYDAVASEQRKLLEDRIEFAERAASGEQFAPPASPRPFPNNRLLLQGRYGTLKLSPSDFNEGLDGIEEDDDLEALTIEGEDYAESSSR